MLEVSNEALATFLRAIAAACTELAEEIAGTEEEERSPAPKKPVIMPRGFSYDRLADLLGVIDSKCVPGGSVREAARLIGYTRLPGEVFRAGWVEKAANDDDEVYLRLTEKGQRRLARLRSDGYGDVEKIRSVSAYYASLIEDMENAR